ncbi:chorismate-binding protein [Flavobacteriaceae bacterium MHTCC 0001]
MQDFFERIKRHYESKRPFVVYRKPQKTEIKAIFQVDDILHLTKDFNDRGFVFSPFDDSADSVIIPISNASVTTVNDWVHQPQSSTQNKQPNNINKAFHVELIKKGVDTIKTGSLQKVVLSRKEEITFNSVRPISIFKNLLHTYASAFVYLWYHPKVGLWLGATPETLLKIEGDHFSIMALAGTQNYNGSLNVQWQQKELKEQQFVTDFILENLSSAIDNCSVSDVETVKAGNLLHLKTVIKGRLKRKDLNFKNLLYSLHPTPAVCGLPKDKAKEFILNNEGYNREFYTGFLGELNFENSVKSRTAKRNIENRAYTLKRKSTQLYVNLRCMQIVHNKGIIYVGGGITESSIPENEWEETVAKSLVVKKVL